MKNKIAWSGFFINLLGVILGITLTFGVNALWQHHSDTKKKREILILLRGELEINKGWFRVQEQYINEDCYVYKKLLEADKKWTSVPKDTLRAYRTQLNSKTFSQLSTSAWQIFQNSEIIQQMTNKDLVIMLATCYNTIDIIKGILDKYYWDKKEKAAEIFETDLYDYFDAVMNNKESVCFFVDIENSNLWEVFLTMNAMIDYTLLLLDRDGNYQYNLKEIGEGWNTMLETRMDSLHQKKDSVGIIANN